MADNKGKPAITEQSAAVLVPSQEQLDAIWAASSDAIALSDADGIVLLANPAYCELYGYAAAEVIGHDFAVIFPDELRSWALENYKQTFAAAMIAPSVETTIRRKDGSSREVEARYSFLTRDGERLAMISTIRDITARKQAEEERLRLLAEAQAARAEAEKALLLRDRVLSVISHDLKNPLTLITGYAQMLKRQLARSGDLDPAHLLAYLEQITGATAMMNTQIDEILDVAQLQSGQQLQLNRGQVDLVELTTKLVARYQQGGENHQVQLKVAQSELIGDWDPTRLERVLDNLLSNAFKYSPVGSVVTVELERAFLPATADPIALATVRDNGVGIPAEELPFIFDWYYRAGNVKRQVQGTGIGLASAREIVRQHGGEIDVTSSAGAGSIFSVWLPLTIPN